MSRNREQKLPSDGQNTVLILNKEIDVFFLPCTGIDIDDDMAALFICADIFPAEHLVLPLSGDQRQVL